MAHAFAPFVGGLNVLIWISSVIVMGIASYWINQVGGDNVGTHVIYIEVIVSAFFSLQRILLEIS
jgi:hypothetical protein